MTMTREMLSARQAGRAVLMVVFGAGLLMLGGCKSANPEYTYPEQIGGTDQHDPTGRSTNSDKEVGSLLDNDGLVGKLFDRDKDDEEKGAEDDKKAEKARREREELAKKGGGAIGVNTFLWRASLETLSFMPLSSADPYGGVIITDWHANPQAPQERFKITVYILDTELRADGVKVAVFRQVLSEEGVWVNQPAAEKTRIDIEDAILTRARQLRVAKLNED